MAAVRLSLMDVIRGRICDLAPKVKTSANVSGPNPINGLEFTQDVIGSHSRNRTIGYARVSTYGQTLDAQLEQLKAAGCVKVYREKATGVQVERQQLQRMLNPMAPGDVVTVTRIDRLARSTFDLFVNKH